MLPDNSWVPPHLALPSAVGSGLTDSWMPVTLCMSHGSSARSRGKGKLIPR